jgi:hypothetical protein
MTDRSTLERRLREASDPSVWDDVSPDAWQQNERRVAADRARRKGRRVRVISAAAAAVLVIVGSAWLRSDHQAMPAHGLDGKTPVPQVTRDGKVHLQGGVVALRPLLPQGTGRFELAFTAAGASSPSGLCQLLVFDDPNGTSSSAESCGGRVAGRDKPNTHVDFFSEGSSGAWLTLAGAVDPAVAKLRVWLADGDVADLPLVDLGSDGYRGFAFAGNGGTQAPMRLAALSSGGALLEAKSLDGTGTAPWPPNQRACEQHKIHSFFTGPLPAGTSVAFSNDSARVSFASGASACIPLKSLAQLPIDGGAMVVIPPEAARVTLRTPKGDQRLSLVTFDALPWRFAVVTAPRGTRLDEISLEISDAAGLTFAGISRQQWPSKTP